MKTPDERFADSLRRAGADKRAAVTPAQDVADRWPLGCHSPNSCSSHGRCMYVGCKHNGKDIAPLATAFTPDPRHTPASVSTPAQEATALGVKEALHYLWAIKVRLRLLYEQSTQDPRLLEHLSDEVDWIDAEIDRLRATSQTPDAAPTDAELTKWHQEWHWADCATDHRDMTIYPRDLRMIKACLATFSSTPSASAGPQAEAVAWLVTAGDNSERHLFFDKCEAKKMFIELDENGWIDTVMLPLTHPQPQQADGQ